MKLSATLIEIPPLTHGMDVCAGASKMGNETERQPARILAGSQARATVFFALPHDLRQTCRNAAM
jgi:hypothetical protein